MQLNISRKRLLFFAILAVFLFVGGTAPDPQQVSAASTIQAANIYYLSTGPTCSWTFLSTDGNCSVLRFKIVVEISASSEVIDTQYKIYSNYVNNTQVSQQKSMAFDECDAPSGTSLDFILYAYNGSITSANLLDTYAGTSTSYFTDACTSAATTTSGLITFSISTGWYYFLLPVGCGIAVILIWLALRWINKD